MLQISHINKEYRTGELVQTALNDVNLNLRDNEFVAILGPSGSGKTTLLNIIGGLDRYDSGDLIINSVSTKQYKDRDWDSYRNHTVGFVFQSYNLIPHQSILANVELALTISGISRKERRNRAKQALCEVGLGDQVHKRPNQLSGGQMQRVAIARSLVNDPDILLADEPTGALDSETSIQVMELLKKVAKDRLVVMVTHNPELADRYATRIVRLHDGRITDDTDPYTVDTTNADEPTHRNMGKASMSLWTALSLSFNNLCTKKGRTLLTSFAGSIGIIGIALILSISSGANQYIKDIQKEVMTSYPVTIEKKAFDLTGVIELSKKKTEDELMHERDGVYVDGRDIEMASSMSSSITTNNLTVFKHYLDDPNSDIHQYIGENGIVYSYATKFNVYTHDSEDKLVNTDGSTLRNQTTTTGNLLGMNQMSAMMSEMGSVNNNFQQLLPNGDGSGISKILTDNYELVYGQWPSEYNQVVFALDEHHEISAAVLYQIGVLPVSEYKSIISRIDAGEEVTIDTQKLDYSTICEKEFRLLPACDLYKKNDNGLYSQITDSDELEDLLDEKALSLHISGIIRPKDGSDYNGVRRVFGYTKALTDYLIEYTDNSDIVKDQRSTPDTNVLSGVTFFPSDDAQKIADVKAYIDRMGISEKATLCKMLMTSLGTEAFLPAASMPNVPQNGANTGDMSSFGNGVNAMPADSTGNATQPSMPSMSSSATLGNMDETQLAALLDRYMKKPDDHVLLSIYEKTISPGSLDDNLDAFGVVSLDAPASVNLYTDSFEAKEGLAACIKQYNQTVSEDDQITYTDYVALLMSSITTIINVISYILMAFVAVSLVVSSIMIGIITYISVLERTKEIGILRAIGASKHNISQVFNAETFMIGLCSGLIGVGITLLLLIPINTLIHSLAGSVNISAFLPVGGAVILIVLSVILTLIGGLIPAKKAAKKDPVIALRSE